MASFSDIDLVREARSRRMFQRGAESGTNNNAGLVSQSAKAVTLSPPASPIYHTPYAAITRNNSGNSQSRIFKLIDFTDRTAIMMAIFAGVGTLLYLDAQRPKWVTHKIQEHDYKEGTAGYDRYQAGGRDVIMWRLIAASLLTGVGSAMLLRLLVPRK